MSEPARVRPSRGRRADYRWGMEIATRWMDNDVFSHVNNVVYYSYFDTLIAHFLLGRAGLDPFRGDIVGMAVETGCRFHASVAFPDQLWVAMRVGHLGRSSVRYEIGIFKGGEDEASAEGHFVHVFVERAIQRPVPIPDSIRTSLTELLASGA